MLKAMKKRRGFFSPPPLPLRQYQQDAIKGVEYKFAHGVRRQIMCAPTGAGKTEIAIELMRIYRERGERVYFLTDALALFNQTSARLIGWMLPHGQIVGEKGASSAPDELVQVASTQTLARNPGWTTRYGKIGLVIMDECHFIYRDVVEEMKKRGVRLLGLTATPLAGELSLHYAKRIVNVTTTFGLQDEGYLVPLKMFRATAIDMKGAKRGPDGEWTGTEVATRGAEIIGDQWNDYDRLVRKHFGKRVVKTVMFGGSIDHAKAIAEEGRRRGYRVIACSSNESAQSNKATVDAFKRGAFDILVSCNMFIKGFDQPDVLCIVGARPFSKSLASVIQQMGRGMRPFPGKSFCLYIDHGGNLQRFAARFFRIWMTGVEKLPDMLPPEDVEAEGDEEGVPDCICPACGSFIMPSAKKCPSCGVGLTAGSQWSLKFFNGLYKVVEVKPPAHRAPEERKGWGELCLLGLRRAQEKPSRKADGENAREYAGRFAAAMFAKVYGHKPPATWPVEIPDADGAFKVSVWMDAKVEAIMEEALLGVG